MCISNWIMWIYLKKPTWNYFFFGIFLQSPHEKHCQMLQRLFFVYFNTLETQYLEAQAAITSQIEWRHEGIKYRAMLDVIKYV